MNRILRSATKQMSTVANYKVVHDSPNKVFFIQLGEEQAYLQYDDLPASQGVDLIHTVVPESHRGQGIAKVLAKDVFDYFVENKTPMKLTCWYLKKYFVENKTPEYISHVINKDL